MSVVLSSDSSFILASITSESSQAIPFTPSHGLVSAHFQLSYPCFGKAVIAAGIAVSITGRQFASS